MRAIKFEKFMLYTLLSVTLSGCMVGPNFHAPRAPSATRYTASPLPKKTVSTPHAGESGKAQAFISKEEIPVEWWTLFHSASLNNLIVKGLANSPTFAAAQATLRQSQEILNAQIGTYLYPAASASISGQRQRITGASLGSDINATLFNVFLATVNVSYTPDVFGVVVKLNRSKLK